MSKSKNNCTHTYVYQGQKTNVGNQEFLTKVCTKCGTKKFEKVKK